MKGNAMEHIFYSVIGKHAGKSPKEILEEKKEEVNANPEKISLWAARVDKKSIEQVWRLNSTDEVYVLCKISENAKDPGGGQKNVAATTMIGPSGEKRIPKWICTTFPDRKKNNNYQAYVVGEYDIRESPMIFDFGKYETILSDNQIRSFKERFEGSTRFQNTFGRKNDSLTESCKKEISVIMKLKYPFVVNIKV